MSRLADFLGTIWGNGPHSLCAATAARPFHTVGVFATPADLLARARRLGPDAHIWYGVHALGIVPSGGRGSEQDVLEVVALCADLDWSSPGAHKTEGLPSEEEVRSALRRLDPELGPPIVVNSGHGLQPLWPLTNAVPADEGLDLQERMSARLAELGLVNERNDLASVLRLPGSHNVKAIPVVPVVLEHFIVGHAFTPQYLDRRLPRPVNGHRRTSGAATRHHTGPLTDEQRALLDYVVAHHGAHSPWVFRDGSVHVVRPGKEAHEGTSASIITGTHGDALLTVFSPNWPVIGPEPPAPSASWVLEAGELHVAHERTDPMLEALEEEAAAEEEADADAEASAAEPNDFFGRHGLRTLNLAQAVAALGPLAMGTDRRLWHYRRGVWLDEGDEVVARRIAGLLRNRFRTAHVTTVLGMLHAAEPVITDAQPSEWLNVANGLLDWHTLELAAHAPDVASTCQLNAAWRPGATCPTIDAWLAEVVDDDVVELVWEIVGMCIYAGEPFHRAVLLAGTGRNGKGTLLRLIEALIGARHVASVPLQTLAENRFAAAVLYGKVANLAGDLDARAVLRSDVFKMATGGDTLTAEHKYGHPFTFTNRATMVFAANETPGSADHSLGYTSRWVVVPFRRTTLTPEAEDKTLEPRMHLELDGALVHAVAGLRRALERGEYLRPPSVEAETALFRRNADPLRRFIDECLEVTGLPSNDVARAPVFDAYRSWCSAEGARAFGSNRFWRELEALDPRIDTGITADNPNGHRVGQTRVVLGIASITRGSMP